MHILLIGDVVGNSGCCFLQERLPQLKRTHQVDLTIVNGENSAQGNGITKHSMEQLFSAGADIITTGNHCFQRREALSIYEKETILRPLNFPDSCPGHGCTIWDNGPYQVAVINLMGTAYMDPPRQSIYRDRRISADPANKEHHCRLSRRGNRREKSNGALSHRKGFCCHRHAHPCTDRRRSHLEPPHRLFNRCWYDWRRIYHSWCYRQACPRPLPLPLCTAVHRSS